MNMLLFLARVFLSVLFAVSGTAKLADLEGSREALGDFGVPERLRGIGSVALPVFELVIAVMLLPARWAQAGALLATGLLLLFTVVVTYQIVRGNRPACHCFGELSSEPMRPRKIAENLALTACAATVAVLGPGLAPMAWIAAQQPITVVALGLAVALTAVLGIVVWAGRSILRQQGRLLLRLEMIEQTLRGRGIHVQGASGLAVDSGRARANVGLPVGSRAPEFNLQSDRGEPVTLGGLLGDGKQVLLIFSDPNCGVCERMMPEVTAWQLLHRPAMNIVVLNHVGEQDGAAHAGVQPVAEAKVTHVGLLADPSGNVARAYRITATPTAVMIAADGIVASGLALGPNAIRALVSGQPEAGGAPQGHSDRDPSRMPPMQLRVGDLAPSIALVDTRGHQVNLEDSSGRRTVVLFWDPRCQYCTQILASLQRWSRSRHQPRLVVVTAALIPEQEGLKGAITVEDSNRSVMGAFGIGGTPAALLFDAEGRVAEEAALGAPAVVSMTQRASDHRPVKAGVSLALEPAVE